MPEYGCYEQTAYRFFNVTQNIIESKNLYRYDWW